MYCLEKKKVQFTNLQSVFLELDVVKIHKHVVHCSECRGGVGCVHHIFYNKKRCDTKPVFSVSGCGHST